MAIIAKPLGRYDLSGSATLNYRFKTLIGSTGNDTVTLNKKYLGAYGALSLGAGTDTVSVASSGDWKLLLKGVDSISAAQDTTTLEVVSDSAFETNGSFTSITGGYGIQTVTFTGASRSNTLSLGDLSDKAVFATASTPWAYVKTSVGIDVYDLTSGYKVAANNDVDTITFGGSDVTLSSLTTGDMGGVSNITLTTGPTFSSTSLDITPTATGVAYISNSSANSTNYVATTRGSSATLTLGEETTAIEGTVRVYMGSSASGLYADFTQVYLGTSGADTRATNATATAIYGFSGADNLTGGAAADTIYGGADGDTIVGSGGADSIYGEDGADTFQFIRSELAGVTTVVGGDGTDIVELTAASTAIVDADFTNFLTVEKLTLYGISSAVLGTLADTAGLTTVVTGAGATQITTSTTTARTVDATSLAENTALTLLDDSVTTNFTVSNLVGNITATTVAGTLTVTCANAADNGITIATGTGNTTVTGGSTGDTITITGLATASQTFAGSGAKFGITAGANAQTITGGALADTITGGTGADVIAGGTGADTFVYTTAADSNGVTAASIDTISDLVLNAALGDLLDFTLTGTLTVATSVSGAATVAAADTTSELNALFNSATGTAATKFAGGSNAKALLATNVDNSKMLVVDVNGDGNFTSADVAIIVTGVTVTSFTTGCFV